MTIKEIKISGAAATDTQVGGFKKRRGTRRRVVGGDEEGEIITSTGPLTINKANGALAAPVAPVAPVIVSQQTQPATAPPTTGGQQQSETRKVELKKSETPRRVHLNPKKEGGSLEITKKEKTRKNRRITLGLVGLHKRLTRAKKIQTKVKEMPIGELKAELIKRGLVKSTTKAPESVLRQIAADAHIVARQDL